MTTTEAFETLMPEPDGWAGRDFYEHSASTMLRPENFPVENARYTAAHMLAMFDAATERAAKQVQAVAEMYDSVNNTEGKFVAGELRHLAAAIRAREDGVAG